MNRRNILRGVAQSNLSAPPAALIYHAVLCCIFAVSLSIIHETQIPFTFFRDFLKVFGALSVKAWRLCQLSQRESQLRLDFQRHLPPKSLPKAPVSLTDALASPRGSCRANARLRGRTPTKSAPITQRSNGGALSILQWIPLTQPWGPREPLLLQPLRRALPERQERQRASEPASPRAWGIRIVLQREEDDVLGALLGAHAAALHLS